MNQPKTFILDVQWQKRQHTLLLELAEDPENARNLVQKMDENPDLRQGLWDVYCRAMETIRSQD